MKYNKGFAPVLIALIVVGILVIGGGGYYLGKSKGEDKKVGENPNVENQGENNQEIKNTDDSSISNLKTYTNTVYGYKFDYSKSRFLNVISSNEISVDDGDCIKSECASLYKIIVKDNVNNLTDLKSLIMSDVGEGNFDCASSNPVWNSNSSKIDNKTTIQLTYSSCAGAHVGMPKTEFGTIYNGKGYILSFVGMYGGEYKGDMKIEFDNIVSSFKFTTSEESTLTKDVTNQLVNIKSVYVKNSKNYIDVDYTQWIVCGADSGCMDGYDIINSNPLIRTFLISDNIIIKMQTFSHTTSGLDKGNYNWNEVVSLEKFKGIINGTIIPSDYEGSLPYKSWFKDLPYSVTVKNGVITEITEHYIP